MYLPILLRAEWGIYVIRLAYLGRNLFGNQAFMRVCRIRQCFFAELFGLPYGFTPAFCHSYFRWGDKPVVFVIPVKTGIQYSVIGY
ncbi:hypothetical protein A2333_02350 [Candidatus Wolfebacteria bacterium RIFOXYB2_FULL_49_7]|nr:MAG: hypothetical protein A2333_02350 [Candidatus Wolfebacteria bacterium RIFOXYB2_FULL_49_7]